MSQRQWKSDDTSKWLGGWGTGVDGDLTISADTTEAPIDSSCSGTATQSTLSATNVNFASNQFLLIHQTRGTGAGIWELNKILSYTAGTITLSYPLINTYTDSGASQAQVRVMKQYNNVTINNTKTYTAKAWNGDTGGILGFFAKGLVTVTGTITSVGKGFRGGAAVQTNNATGYTGESSTAASSQSASANGMGGGGGAGDDNGASHEGSGGGGGGYATGGTAGENGNGATGGGAAGGTGGAASLTTLFFGGGGGSGGNDNVASGPSGVGGASGGAIIILGKNITIT